MRKTDQNIIDIVEDTELKGTGVILEKGDRIRVLSEGLQDLVTQAFALNNQVVIAMGSHKNFKGLEAQLIKLLNQIKAQDQDVYSDLASEFDMSV